MFLALINQPQIDAAFSGLYCFSILNEDLLAPLKKERRHKLPKGVLIFLTPLTKSEQVVNTISIDVFIL